MKGKIPIILASAFGMVHCMSPAAFSKTCLTLSDNEQGYGSFRSLVVSQNYLAFTDVGKNRVTVYQRNPQDRWSKSHDITPPPNSPVAKIGGGFGYSMALDGSNLIIGTFFIKEQPAAANQSTHPFTFMPPNSNSAYGGAIYRTDVRKPAPIQRIDQPKSGEVAGFNVAADKGSVAFPVNYYDSKGVLSSYTAVVSGKMIRSINIPSGTVAIKNNILVVGDNTSLLGTHNKNSMSVLSVFDLKKSNQLLRKIEANFLVFSISISDQLIAATGSHHAWRSPESQQKALIINIRGGSEYILKGSGMIYAYQKLLIRYYPYTFDYETPGQIELFDFQNINKPRLLYSQKKVDIQSAQLNNQEIYTTEENRLCIETFPKGHIQ
jgi:hypothetical protein